MAVSKILSASLNTGATVSSTSTGSGTASSVSSNTYTNIVSSIALPNNSLIIAQYTITSSNGNTPSEATYGCYVSTAATSSGTTVAYQDGVSVYPQAGIGGIGACLMYFNRTGSSQNIWLAGYPYASANYNTPTYSVTYYIVSFS